MSTLSTQKTKQYMLPFGCVLGLCLSVTSVSTQAVEVNFSAVFESPTCEVSAPASIDFGNISSQGIKQGDSLMNPRSLIVSLSNCSGLLSSAQKPGLKVSGTGNTEAGDFLFMLPATSVAVNYGVLLTTALNNTVISNGTFIPTTGAAGSLPSNGTSIAFNAALSCGTQCNNPTTRSGELNAAIIFEFAYE